MVHFKNLLQLTFSYPLDGRPNECRTNLLEGPIAFSIYFLFFITAKAILVQWFTNGSHLRAEYYTKRWNKVFANSRRRRLQA